MCLGLQCLRSSDVEHAAFMLQTHHAEASEELEAICFLQSLDVAHAIGIIQIQSANHGDDKRNKPAGEQ